MSKTKKYWIFTLLGTLALSIYPICMGISVINDMTKNGTVLEPDFPKYIIPYTPIAIAVIIAVSIMPLLFKLTKKYAVLFASVFSVGIFFIAEFLFENKVIVTSTMMTTLESWQMFMCAVNPYEIRNLKAVDILMGAYSPTFKIHFYLISVALIISTINCMYGFATIIKTGNKKRLKSLIVQSILTISFLGMCIFACFTAFFRDGAIKVSPVSAFLMCLFFILLGVLAGTYIGSFLLEKKKTISVLVPSISASVITLVMYIGEMFLLRFNLFQLGTGFLFEPINNIVLAPFDILIIIAAGIITAIICLLLNKKCITQTEKQTL